MIYFAQCRDGGSIKIGHTDNWAHRSNTLRSATGRPIELVASIPGDLRREQVLLHVLRPYRVQGEWFANHPNVWRVIIEAIDTGDLEWLPQYVRGPSGGKNSAEYRALRDTFGGAKELAAALGYANTCGLTDLVTNHGLWARVAVMKARMERRLPAYLLEAA